MNKEINYFGDKKIIFLDYVNYVEKIQGIKDGLKGAVFTHPILGNVIDTAYDSDNPAINDTIFAVNAAKLIGVDKAIYEKLRESKDEKVKAEGIYRDTPVIFEFREIRNSGYNNRQYHSTVHISTMKDLMEGWISKNGAYEKFCCFAPLSSADMPELFFETMKASVRDFKKLPKLQPLKI